MLSDRKLVAARAYSLHLSQRVVHRERINYVSHATLAQVVVVQTVGRFTYAAVVVSGGDEASRARRTLVNAQKHPQSAVLLQRIGDVPRATLTHAVVGQTAGTVTRTAVLVSGGVKHRMYSVRMWKHRVTH